jgi:dihydrofolate reductase
VSKVVLDISVSLDGYVAGPNDGIGSGLGHGGEPLHNWIFGGPWTYESASEPGASATGVDREVLDQMFGSGGAAIVGRRMFDVVEGWGYQNPFPFPCLVLTHRITPELLEQAPSFTFVDDGIESALAQAREVAGDKDVAIGGGAQVARQYLGAGLLDEMQLHYAPFLLGGGIRLFDGLERIEFQPIRVIESPNATHVRYRVVK